MEVLSWFLKMLVSEWEETHHTESDTSSWRFTTTTQANNKSCISMTFTAASAVGQIDWSGIRIHYTTTLRKYDAGLITLGDPLVSFEPIPPGVIAEYEAECPSVRKSFSYPKS